MPKEFKMSEIRLNYFGEYHGKSEVDSHFGLLSRLLKEAERKGIIKNLTGLINLYTEYSKPESFKGWPMSL